MLTSPDGTGVGFVRHAYGMTITLTGYNAHQRELKQAILAARPASSADMRDPVDEYSTLM